MGGLLLVLLVVIVGMIAGGLQGGRLEGLTQAEVRLAPLLLVSLALQGAVSVASWLGWLSPVVPMVMLVALATLLLFAAANYQLPGMLLLGLGVLCNLLVIGVNDGMPVTDAARERAGQVVTRPAPERPDAEHVRADEGTGLRVLADALAVRPFRTVVSVGDIAQYAGVFLLVQGLMASAAVTGRSRFGEFDYGIGTGR